MRNFTYRQALKYLESFPDYEKTINYNLHSFKPERVECLLNLMGNPHWRLKAIQIAGTKGKGSTAAMVASILDAEGFKVGLYTSPHLISLRERIKIGEELISEKEICDLVNQIRPCIPKLEKTTTLGIPTFFEVYTVLAFLFFAKKKTDFVVLEVGMGGRLDATNVINPLVAVITPIGFDHTHILGDTLASITKEKTGIIKDNNLVITSTQAKDVLNLIKQKCIKKKARLYEVGRDINFKKISSDLKGQNFDICGVFNDYKNLFMPLLGDHQLINAATAIGTIELLSVRGVYVSSAALRGGLRKIKWPGRMEVVSKKPTLILDGAQNEISARALRKFLVDNFPQKKLFLVFGILKDKNVRGVGLQLCPLATEVILTKMKAERAIEPSRIREKLTDLCEKIVLANDIEEALNYVWSISCSEDVICVTGSLYLVGETKAFLQRRNRL